MKAYTDLEQSKKLTEILPIESADMSWCNNSIRGVNYTNEYSANLYTIKEMQECFDKALNGWDKYWKLFPCWSLAALIKVMPFGYFIHPTKNGVTIKYDYGKEVIAISDNLVDACYKMILKLHEQKLI